MKQGAEGSPDVAGASQTQEAAPAAAVRVTGLFAEAIREAIPAEGEEGPEGDGGGREEPDEG